MIVRRLPVAPALWIVCALAFTAALILYVFHPGMPFSFYSDLGVDIATTARMTHAVHGAGDVASFFGWQPWYDYPEFLYSPMLAYAVSLPLDLLLHDAATTIKLVQVLQFLTAGFGAAAAYRLLFGRSLWSCCAGVLYAAVPMVALEIRGNMSIGWVVALIPAVYAAGVLLVRRFGWPALPVAAIFAALGAFCFDTEYGILASLPLYLAVAFQTTCWKTWMGRLCFVAGLICLALTPAYVILPTVFGAHVFGWSATASHEFSTVPLLQRFSQNAISFTGILLREDIVSPRPELNATASTPWALLGGAIVWAAVVLFAVLRFTTIRRRWLATATLCAVLAALSVGPGLPLLGWGAWWFFSKAPVVNALRTPDRFFSVAAFFLVLAAVRSFASAFQQGRFTRLVSVALPLIAIAGFVVFDGSEHVLTLQDAQRMMPDLPLVTREVTRLGGRTFSLAFVKNGSIFDTPLYGVPLPTASYGWDVAGRFAGIDGGVALLRRGAVNSIVTSPSWLVEGPELPADLGDRIAASGFARATWASGQGVRVFSVDGARPLLFDGNLLCYSGTPQAFEAAAGMDIYRDDALVTSANAACAHSVSGDFDPVAAALTRHRIAFWTGRSMFGTDGLAATPYAFEVGRLFLADRWYQKSWSVSANLFSTNQLEMTSLPLQFSVGSMHRYSLFVRASGPGALSVLTPSGQWRTQALAGTRSFTWLRIPFGALKPGSYRVALDLRRPDIAQRATTIDAAMVVPDTFASANAPPTQILSSAAFVPDEAAAPVAMRIFPVMQARGFTPSGQQIELLRGATLREQNRDIAVRGPSGWVSFVWTRPSGTYELMAIGWLDGIGSQLSIHAGGASAYGQYDAFSASDPTSVFLRAHLHRGDVINVRITSPLKDGRSTLAFLEAVQITASMAPSAFGTNFEQYVWSPSTPLEAVAVTGNDRLDFHQNSIGGYPGATAVARFTPHSVGAGEVEANIRVSHVAPGSVELACGHVADSSPIVASEIHLEVRHDDRAGCRVRVNWFSYNMRIASVRARAVSDTLHDRHADVAFSGGRVHVAEILAGQERPLHGDVDGTPIPASGEMMLSRGLHRVHLRDVAAAFTGMFITPRTSPAAAAPLPPPVVRRVSDTEWGVQTSRAGTLELAELYDGNWTARGSERAIQGFSCDLINTCFNLPAAARVTIYHKLPTAIFAGLLTSAFTVLLALAALGITRARARASAEYRSVPSSYPVLKEQ